MKRTIVRIILSTLLLATAGTTSVLADGPEPRPPFCPPNVNCN
jgi:hypothetical protein